MTELIEKFRKIHNKEILEIEKLYKEKKFQKAFDKKITVVQSCIYYILDNTELKEITELEKTLIAAYISSGNKNLEQFDEKLTFLIQTGEIQF
jgi:hypothetical protein